MMDDIIEYDLIKNKIQYDFSKYVNEDHFTVRQAAARIITDNCMAVNFSIFTRVGYILNVAIESVKMGEITDYIYEEAKGYSVESLDGIPEEEESLYKQDLEFLIKLLNGNSYKVIGTSDADKVVINSFLNLRSDLLYLKLKYKTGNMVNQEVIRKYSMILPGELMQIWKKYGFCSLMEEYLKIINPDDYQKLLNDIYFRGMISIPILITAFGDIITYEEGGYIGIVRSKDGSSSVISRHFKKFMSNLTEKSFTDKYLEIPQYVNATYKLGSLEFDECFAYVPLLELDGSGKTQDKYIKIKTREHIESIFGR